MPCLHCHAFGWIACRRFSVPSSTLRLRECVQKCLKEQDYQQHQCQDVIDRLHTCCETYNLFGRSPNCAGLPRRAASTSPSSECASSAESASPASGNPRNEATGTNASTAGGGDAAQPRLHPQGDAAREAESQALGGSSPQGPVVAHEGGGAGGLDRRRSTGRRARASTATA